MAKERRVSHTTFVSAGLLSDVDVTFNNCRFMRWTYPNTKQEITVFAIDAETEDGETHELTWSVGGDDDFMPSKDGMYLIADEDSDRNNLAKNSKFQAFVKSLEDNGLEGEHMKGFDESSDYLDGTVAHILRVPYKGFSGGGGSTRRRGGDDEERQNEVVVVGPQGIISFPWDKKGGKKGAKSAGSGSSSGSGSRKAGSRSKKEDADDGGEGDAETTASKIVKKVLMKGGGSMEADELVLEAYTMAKEGVDDKKQRKEIMDLVNDKKWLAKVDDVEVDGDTVSME